MSLIFLHNVSLSFGARKLFDRIHFQVNDSDRIGLVGPNGTGKTTLLRLIVGEVTPEEGELRKLKRIRVGYLPQEALDVPDRELLPWVLEAVPGLTDLRQQIEDTENELKTASGMDEQTELGQRLSHLYSELNHIDSIFSPYEAERILLGLGFHDKDFTRSILELSGGWKMRASLARLLFQQPDVLLLDEPTNHLDAMSVHWLDEYLSNYEQAIVLICHDREFLNRHIRKVVSLEEEGIRTYSGTYDQYVQAREQEERILEAKARNQEQKVRQAQRFIERFRYKSTKARQAQSKIKLLDKMEMVQTFKRRKSIEFSFPPVEQSGREVITLSGIAKRFGVLELYRDLNLNVQRGERVAIIGPNGSGKTTLLRIMANELPPDEGRISYGHNVKVSYYAQHHTERLNPAATVIEEVHRSASDASVGHIRSVCGAFLFSGDDVDKAVGILSGGEKARVALARLLVTPGNVMLMDEPTNHLDLMSSEVLISALATFGGTLVFVSHNQSFVNRLATRIWNIESKGVEEYPGNLRDYFYHRELKERQNQKGPAVRKDIEHLELQGEAADFPSVAVSKDARKEQRRTEARRRQMISAAVDPIRKELAVLEKRIEELERKERDISNQLADPEIYADTRKSKGLLGEYTRVKEELEGLLRRWENRQLVLEETMSRIGSEFQASS